MGEHKRVIHTGRNQGEEPMIVDTPGGRIHVRWDMQTYATPQRPQLVDVLGTWLLAILSGHKRYGPRQRPVAGA